MVAIKDFSLSNKHFYVITFSAITDKGFFVFNPYSISVDIEFKKFRSEHDALINCTKFRVKLIADLFCYLLNKRSTNNFELITWKVQKVVLRKSVYYDYFLVDEFTELHISKGGPEL